MAEQVAFTVDDRRLIQRMHDALLGTLEQPGGLSGKVNDLAGKVEDVATELRGHTDWNHDDPHEVAKGAAQVAMQLHESRKPHLAVDRRGDGSFNAKRFIYDVLKNVVTVGVVAIAGWIVGVWMLGWRVSQAVGGQ